MTVLLETRNLGKMFGAFRALEAVSISVHDGEILTIVGPNGAGKTTLVNLLTGLLAPSEGEVLFEGRNIAGVGPVLLADLGMARSFQLISVFPKLTVSETLAAAIVSRQRKRWRLLSSLRKDESITKEAERVARMFGLADRLHAPCETLPQGEKKLIDVASAFALNPQIILLDEPTSGVSTSDKHTIMRTLIDAAKKAGVRSIILVEHDMDLVEAYSHRIVALAEGRVIADLSPNRFFADPMIIEQIVGKRRAPV